MSRPAAHRPAWTSPVTAAHRPAPGWPGGHDGFVGEETSGTDHLLAEQLGYYRARAGEYDRWFRREGRYDRGADARAAWFAEIGEVRAALGELPIDGCDVAELAAGTGIWTEALAARAAHVTAVDASPEMIAENRRKLGPRAGRVTYVAAGLFQWHPGRTWDAVVFCFWISHVPQARLDGFLSRWPPWSGPADGSSSWTGAPSRPQPPLTTFCRGKARRSWSGGSTTGASTAS